MNSKGYFVICVDISKEKGKGGVLIMQGKCDFKIIKNKINKTKNKQTPPVK